MRKLVSFLRTVQFESNEDSNSLESRKDVSEVDEKTVIFLAQRIIGEEYGRCGSTSLIPKSFSDGRLFIAAKNGLWSEEFRCFQKDFLHRMKELTGTGVIRSVKVSNEYS